MGGSHTILPPFSALLCYRAIAELLYPPVLRERGARDDVF
jgi:hypothetical protein